MAAKGSITIRTGFPAGAKVALHRRVGDGGPSGDPVKTAQASKTGEVRFTDLEPYEQFYAVADVDGGQKVVQVTAKGAAPHPDLANTRTEHRERLRAQAEAGAKAAAEAVKKDPLAASPALDGPDPSRQITGQRGTGNSQRVQLRDPADESLTQTFSSEQAGKATPKDAQGGEPQPHPRQEDVPDKTPQMSATLTGEATPTVPGQLVPEIPQSEVDDKTSQRSDTERGSAAIVPDGEVSPALKQEDVPDGTPQRSSTELGNAEPIPQGDPIDVKRNRDSSQAKAEGATRDKPLEETVKGAAKKRSSSSKRSGSKKAAKRSSQSKASRSRAAKKAAATRKRNAAKKGRKSR